MQKPKLTRSGIKMLTVLVKVHILFSEIVLILFDYLDIHNASDLEEFEARLNKFTKRDFERHLKRYLTCNGASFISLSERLEAIKDRDRFFECEKLAKEFLEFKYPDWRS